MGSAYEMAPAYPKTDSDDDRATLLKRFLLRADELVNRGSQGEAYSRTLKRGDRKPKSKADAITNHQVMQRRKARLGRLR